MNIPKNNLYALDLEVRKGRKAHGEAVRNIIYKPRWIELFGRGN